MLLWSLDEGWSKRVKLLSWAIHLHYPSQHHTISKHALPASSGVLLKVPISCSIFKTHIFYSIPIPELKESRASVTAIKKQAESTNAEYDRLAEENQKLQVRLDFATYSQNQPLEKLKRRVW